MRILALVITLTLAAHAEGPSKPPHMRGTLWWVAHPDYLKWSKADFEREIGEQQAVGFDLLWIMGTPHLVQKAVEAEKNGAAHDVLELILQIADERKLSVIVDLPPGGWYGKTALEDLYKEIDGHIQTIHARYGKHPSLFGWYLNHEVNPVAPGEQKETTYWRTAWKRIVQTCHAAAPKMKVTISPFFLLDDTSRRGFVYLNPAQYAELWGKTLKETGIDIMMLQDSGEHLSFFTLEQREPFFAAMRDAAHAAGAQLWVNVETGHANVKDWDEYLALAKDQKEPWCFTPMDWLAKKLALAARYGDSVVNWGYYPFMDPSPMSGDEKAGTKEAYQAYKTYWESGVSAGTAE